jgi:PAS domain-containing protein
MMATVSNKQGRQDELRSRAVAQITGSDPQMRPRLGTSDALSVLYDLACSPSTAADALALLHELQVHQVEVDLQDEELRRSRAEIETALDRQVRLYDNSPVGQITVDGHLVLHELNRTGALLLGSERDALRGRSLESLIAPEAVSSLRAMLARVTEGNPIAYGELPLRGAKAAGSGCIYASVCLDSEGGGFLIGLMPCLGTRPTIAA